MLPRLPTIASQPASTYTVLKRSCTTEGPTTRVPGVREPLSHLPSTFASDSSSVSNISFSPTLPRTPTETLIETTSIVCSGMNPYWASKTCLKSISKLSTETRSINSPDSWPRNRISTWLALISKFSRSSPSKTRAS